MKINGIDISADGWPSPQLAAAHELLRQQAVAQGLLSDDADEQTIATAVEQLLKREVQIPEPTDEECRRWYDAHGEQYRNGDLVHARHILFQITPGAPVAAIRSLAEQTLGELQAQPDLFEQRAREQSNCPSGAQGGQLGQLQRGDTVAEFEEAIFRDGALGILPELVHTRFGFHIVALDQRIPGQQLPFAAVAGQIAEQLRATCEERALGQYVRVLAGQAELQGVDLDAATSPLMQ